MGSRSRQIDYITVLAPRQQRSLQTPLKGNAPHCQFTDNSTGNVTAWSWNFGDGNTRHREPNHTYTTPGIYPVTLNAQRLRLQHQCPTTITVLLRRAAFVANVTAGNALAVRFTDQSTGSVTAWSWNFVTATPRPCRTPSTPTSAALHGHPERAMPTGSRATRTNYITVLAPPAANSQTLPQVRAVAVQFTDQSTENVTTWLWNFGDGNTSAVKNPIHTYAAVGNYTVTLNVSNAYGNSTLARPNYIQVTEKSFIDYVIDENVFVYGNVLQFGGGNVNGHGSTIIITGGLTTSHLNGGASINVSNIYIDGSVTLDHGSAGLGSATSPGDIYINGDLTLWNGQRHIYGNVYVDGDFSLKDARIHGNVYVNGNLTLDNTPEIVGNARINYTGTLKTPEHYNSGYATNIVAKCIHRQPCRSPCESGDTLHETRQLVYDSLQNRCRAET